MGGMDFSGGSTYGDLGQAGAAARPQSMQRKLSAHKLGTKALPQGGMNFNDGSTASDLGNFYDDGDNNVNPGADGVAGGDLILAAQPNLSATLPFPLSTGETAVPRMRRRGSMPGIDPSLTMDFSAGSTLSDLGAHSHATKVESVSSSAPSRMRRRGSMPGIDP